MEDLQNRSAQETRQARLHHSERLQAHRPPGRLRQASFGVRQRNLGVPRGTTHHPTKESIWWQKRTYSDGRSPLTSGIHQTGLEKEKRGSYTFLDIKGAFPNVA